MTPKEEYEKAREESFDKLMQFPNPYEDAENAEKFAHDQAFDFGVQYERERSKKLVAALEFILTSENKVFLTHQMLRFSEKALADFEGGNLNLNAQNEQKESQ